MKRLRARVYVLPRLLERFGPLRALEYCTAWGDLDGASSEDRHYLFSQRAHIAMLLRAFDEASEWLQRAEAALPGSPWLATHRAEIAYRQGRFADTVTQLRSIRKSEYHAKFADRLAASDAPARNRRVELPVPFVRQHWMTCAPATLAALTAYWGQPVDHLALASEICYDGTPGWRERDWLERHGWVTREFRLTWDAAQALLDRGIPFAVSTVGTTNSHRQAVIGYDLLRDDPDPARAESELIRHVLFGDALQAYRREAHGIIEPEELLASLQKALHERPDLWQAWSAVVLQLVDMQRPDDALALAEKAVLRFPVLPRLYLDLAYVHQARLQPRAAVDALKRAVEINPNDGPASRRLGEILADLLLQDGSPTEAEQVVKSLREHGVRSPHLLGLEGRMAQERRRRLGRRGVSAVLPRLGPRRGPIRGRSRPERVRSRLA